RLDTLGRIGLAKARQHSPDLAKVEIALPSVLFTEGTLLLHLGKKTVQLLPSPGHSPDSLAVFLKEDRILFAGDTMMPLPHFVDGDIDDLTRSLQAIPPLGLENVIQGHGEVILRGEIDDAVRSNLRYLEALRKKVEQVLKRGKSREAARNIEIESCGKSRIPLNGLVLQLHAAKCVALYDKLTNSK
ncbi:MAG: MBL fold metallo-hydrolase, partial [Anaerolineales bacterium]